MDIETSHPQQPSTVRSLTPGEEAEPVLRVVGDAHIRTAKVLPCGLHCTGDFTLEDGASVRGSVYAEGSVRLGRNTQVLGALRVDGHLDVAPGAAAGALDVKGDVRVSGTPVGRGLRADLGFQVDDDLGGNPS